MGWETQLKKYRFQVNGNIYKENTILKMQSREATNKAKKVKIYTENII